MESKFDSCRDTRPEGVSKINTAAVKRKDVDKKAAVKEEKKEKENKNIEHRVGMRLLCLFVLRSRYE